MCLSFSHQILTRLCTRIFIWTSCSDVIADNAALFPMGVMRFRGDAELQNAWRGYVTKSMCNSKQDVTRADKTSLARGGFWCVHVYATGQHAIVTKPSMLSRTKWMFFSLFGDLDSRIRFALHEPMLHAKGQHFHFRWDIVPVWCLASFCSF